jgi:predicted aconitase
MEMEQVAGLIDGRRVDAATTLIVTTSPEIKFAADRMGITASIEGAGGMVLSGVCFYQMYARDIGEANGWKRLATNSAKLVNILGGYGYVPLLATMERCVEAAEKGALAP